MNVILYRVIYTILQVHSAIVIYYMYMNSHSQGTDSPEFTDVKILATGYFQLLYAQISNFIKII